MAEHRYRSNKVPRGVTREAIAWLGSDKQRSIILRWIHEQFDPIGADHILFEERDAWDAAEEVWDEFSTLVDEDVIEDAIRGAFGGAGFVRKANPRFGEIGKFDRQRLLELGDHARTGGQVSLGTVLELRERATLAHLVNDLLAKAAEIEAEVGTPGHNRGPVDDSTPIGEFSHVANELRAISTQLSSSVPTPDSIASSALSIEHIAARHGWDQPQSSSADAYRRAFFETLGKDHAHMLNGALIAFICLIYELLKQVVGWLEVAVL
jgi:hypothetical protein